MFYDERIELAKGKICRNSLVIALFMAMIIGTLRFICVKSIDDASALKSSVAESIIVGSFFIAVEIAVFVCSATVLAVGAVRAIVCQKDERFMAEQSAFYIKASYVCINIVMICASIVFPLNLIAYRFMGMFASIVIFDKFLLILFFTIGNYTVYNFKKKDIYLNYDLMEEENYYKGVWKNIGKLCKRMLRCFVISATVDILISLLLRHFLLDFIAIFIFDAIVTAVLIGLYLLYSCLERSSYNSSKIVSRATVVSLLIAVLVYALYSAVSMYFFAMLGSETAKLELVAQTSEAMQSIWIFAVLMFLTYFGYEYQKKKPNKLLSASILMIVLSIALCHIFSEIQTSISIIIIKIAEDIEARTLMSQSFYTLVEYFMFAVCVANSVGFVLTVFALIKDRSIGKSHIISVVLLGVLWGVEIFAYTHSAAGNIRLYQMLANIFALVSFYIMILSVSSRDKKSLDKTEPV